MPKPSDPIFQGDTVSYNEAFMHALDKADAAGTTVTIPRDHTSSDSFIEHFRKAQDRTLDQWMDREYGALYHEGDPEPVKLEGMEDIVDAKSYVQLAPWYVRALDWFVGKQLDLLEWLEEK